MSRTGLPLNLAAPSALGTLGWWAVAGQDRIWSQTQWVPSDGSPLDFKRVTSVSYKLALPMGACHLPLQELNHVLLTFNTPLKGVQGREQEWSICDFGGCGGETGRTGLHIVRYFQELIWGAKFLYLLISRKALKSFIVTFASGDYQ